MEAMSGTPRPAAALPVTDLGRVGYERAWTLQRRLVEQRAAEEVGDVLLVCEHDPVVTTGRGSRGEAAREARFPRFAVERGGQATYHGPGQIVAYPIVALAPERRDLHAWMRALEDAVVATLADAGLRAGRVPGATGVWVGDGVAEAPAAGRAAAPATAPPGAHKLCSIGVAARRWVTYHGLALNHDPDLSHFGVIDPCGFDARVMTSMRAELGTRCPPRAEVVARLVEHLGTALAPFAREDR